MYSKSLNIPYMNSFNLRSFSSGLIKPEHPDRSIVCAESLKCAMYVLHDSFPSYVILKNDHMSMYIGF